MSEAVRAVVFAYHTVGVRSLEILLRHGVAIPLVVTHQDDPAERVWFESVLELARLNDLPVITPADPNAPEVCEQVAACRPDWLFSFYYRYMLGPELLAIPARGGVNLHGSLLPKYRGLMPSFWMLANGEREGGVSVHFVNEKLDDGPIVVQKRYTLHERDCLEDVMARSKDLAAEAIIECVHKVRAGDPETMPRKALARTAAFAGPPVR